MYHPMAYGNGRCTTPHVTDNNYVTIEYHNIASKVSTTHIGEHELSSPINL